MKIKMHSVVLSLVIVLAILSQGIAADKPLRGALEQRWSDYLKASKSGKESELKRTMSAFRFREMTNNLASAGRSLTPGMIQSIAEDAPDISKARFVNLMENGPTAGLVYVTDSEEQDASNKPRVEFLFIKFVKEESGWKVDGVMNIGSPKFQADGKETEFDPSDLPPTYEIDGKLHGAPEPVSNPDVSAVLDVSSYGYKTQITINGVDQGTTVDKSRSGLIKEGLHKGENNIVIVFTQTENDPAFKPSVTIRRIASKPDKEEVLKFAPDDNINGKHSFTFMIDE